MAKIETITLKGCSGRAYDFDVYSKKTNFKELGAIYFISRKQNESHTIIYIGITENLSTRFNNHHKQDCFDKHNANYISVHLSSSKKERESIEEDILCNYNFPYNEVNN